MAWPGPPFTRRTARRTGRVGAHRRDGRRTAWSDRPVLPARVEPPHLVWTANLAALELHPSLASAPDLLRPRSVVFDLDPGPGADVLTCAQVALWLRELLDHARPGGMAEDVGLQGAAGLRAAQHGRDLRCDPRLRAGRWDSCWKNSTPSVTTNMNPSVRPDKVFVDWSQNVASKTTVAVYSLRARARPTASTPVTWEEVSSATDPGQLRFEAGEVLARVERDGDLFAPLLTTEQEVPSWN